MTDPAQHDHDPDAALMERAAAIAQEERRSCSCECADVRLCDIVARLAVRVARAEGNDRTELPARITPVAHDNPKI